MKQSFLFGGLLRSTYAASEATEPIERYYASMFAGYYEQTDSQPSCAAVNAIARGERTVPWKLLHYYGNSNDSRCPVRLAGDLSLMADCFFSDAIRRRALQCTLEQLLTEIPVADAEDICRILCKTDLVQMWTCLTWYTLCGDHYGTTSY